MSRLFSSKLGILKVLLDRSIAGDDQPVAVQNRPNDAKLLDGQDSHAVFAGFAARTTAINERTSDVCNLLSRAADADPEAATFLGTLRQQRDQGQGHVVRAFHRRRALRPGLSEREAADIVHAIMAPEIYRLLVHDRGWTSDHFRRWATDTLTQQLTELAGAASTNVWRLSRLHLPRPSGAAAESRVQGAPQLPDAPSLLGRYGMALEHLEDRWRGPPTRVLNVLVANPSVVVSGALQRPSRVR